MITRRPVRAAIGVTAAVLLAACAPAEDAEGVQVVATTTILGDIAGRIVECGGGEAKTLMPIGVDPHDFAASAAEIAQLVRADLVVANGLGLEEGLTSALESARRDGARVLEVAQSLDPIGDDPHVWLDASRMSDASRLIGDQLSEVTGDAEFAECGAAVAAELTALHTELGEVLSEVPREARVLITDHDALDYFAQAYGFEVIGVVIPGGSTMAEPSSEALAALAGTIRETGVAAVFADAAQRQVIVEALAAEVGEVDVVTLYVGSLGPEGSGAQTYPDLMRANARLIVEALS